MTESQGQSTQDQHLSEQGLGLGTLSLSSRLSLRQMAEPLQGQTLVALDEPTMKGKNVFGFLVVLRPLTILRLPLTSVTRDRQANKYLS